MFNDMKRKDKKNQEGLVLMVTNIKQLIQQMFTESFCVVHLGFHSIGHR